MRKSDFLDRVAEHPVIGTLRPQRPEQSVLPLLEASARAAGLPGASLLAQEAAARGYFRCTLAQQWCLIQQLLAEHLAEAEDPESVARAWGRLPDPRARFHLPGAWTRFALDGPPAPALELLREWAAEGSRLVAEWLPESGVRPWAQRLGPEVLGLLMPWTQDPEPEVRRAAVVALRPRGVWVPQLQWAVEEPARILPLLEALRGDAAPRVAAAVANALNDLARAQPELTLAILHRWREEGSGPLAEQIARKGLRGLIKRRDPRAQALLGLDSLRLRASARLRGGPLVRPNSSLIFDLEVHNDGEEARAQLVYEIETPGRLAGKPRRQRVQAAAYLLPARDRVRLIVRERIFDRRAAPLLEGPGRARFFLNGVPCGEAGFTIRRPGAAGPD